MGIDYNKLILFQGDSITDGGRIKNNNTDLNHQIGHSYAYVISSKLGYKEYDKKYMFMNRGISGNRIADLYCRIQEDIINLRPDIVSILIGVNDAYFHFNNNSGSSPKKYEKIYRLIIEEIKENLPNSKLIICEPFILKGNQNKENYYEWKELISEYQRIVKKLSKEYNIPLVLLQDKFNEMCSVMEPEYWVWDGVHPTEAGHYLIAEEWLKVFDEMK